MCGFVDYSAASGIGSDLNPGLPLTVTWEGTSISLFEVSLSAGHHIVPAF